MPEEIIMQQLLFGGEEVAKNLSSPGTSPYQSFKRSSLYRKAKNGRKSSKCCATCRHCRKKDFHDRTYYKCQLMGISASPATDIRLSCVCNRWENDHGSTDSGTSRNPQGVD